MAATLGMSAGAFSSQSSVSVLSRTPTDCIVA
jgi:hypothetical protein